MRMADIPFKGMLCFMQKRFLKTSSTSILQPLSSSFTVQYLVNSCGLPLETAVSTSRKLQLQLDQTNIQKHDSIINFLKSHGFSDTHIAKLITKRPSILQSRLDETLSPKIQCLLDNGFSGSNLAEVIVLNPIILGRSLTSHLKPSIDFLKKYIGIDEKVVATVKRSSWLLTADLKGTMQPNVDFLISEGVPETSISKLITLQPRAIMQNVDNMVCAVKSVKQWGVQPDVPGFVHAVRVKVSLSESTWNKKMELFKSLGWSEEGITSAFIHEPALLACSEEKIKNAMDFYLNTMKVELEVIKSYPKFLMFGLDKRIRPRYNVFKLLQSKKLLKANMKFHWLLTQPKERFLRNYVLKHLDKVPDLMKVYRGTIPASDSDL